MKRKSPIGNLMASVCATGILLYVMGKTTSPKIILLPFLICALSLAGKSIAQMLHKEKLVVAFHKCFVGGFVLFWMGFLAVAGYICIRDENYGMLIFLVPFLLVGCFLIKNKLLGKKSKTDGSPFRFANIISAGLVGIALLSGVVLLVLGIQRTQWGLAFMGVFFLCGGGAFVLGALTVRGTFDKAKIDVLGLYVGIVFAVLGIGFTTMLYQLSENAGLWILIPLLMTAAGVVQVIKCLKNKE